MFENTSLLPSITALAPEVVDQIAAGEVVERPSHLVKELFENSIDAGATEIEVEVFESCTSFRVTDNGFGIQGVDLPKALDRHATSKIRRTEDLWALRTYGFRGEALASIAAVSDLSLQSRPRGEATGCKIRSEFGQRAELVEVGHPEGTSIQIERLFENVPARRKFMKSPSAETAAVRQVVKALSLAHPTVSIKFLVSGKLDLFFPKARDLKERAKAVLEVRDLYSHSIKLGDEVCEVVFAHPKDAQKSSRNM
jgi:DNA mismatch repair protein MutL